MSEIKYTEGVCEDGAAILSDGRMMTIREVLEALNASEEHRVSLRLSQDSAIRLQHTVDVLRDENTELAESVEDLRAEVERHSNAAAASRLYASQAKEALIECEEYFDNRADAEYTTDSAAPRPNEEMKLLMIVRNAIMKAELQHEDGKRQIC